MKFFEQAAALERNGESFVIVTMLAVRGHAPQDVGAKILVTAAGLAAGTVGGGKVEAKAIALGQELLAKAPPPEAERIFSRKWNLQRDVGMSCGGEVDFLFELRASANQWPIIVFGAGHIAQALVPLLLTLECNVTCVDPRTDWLERLPPASEKFRKILADYTAPIADFPSDAFYVVMTQGHSTDLPVIETVLARGTPPYFGVIGSEVKALKIRRELKEHGIAPETIKALRCPMGFDIGSNAPAEIAISIAAELLDRRR